MASDPPGENYYGLVEMAFSFGVVLALGFWQLRSIKKAREKLRGKGSPPKQ